jgi:hypothetical protein
MAGTSACVQQLPADAPGWAKQVWSSMPPVEKIKGPKKLD